MGTRIRLMSVVVMMLCTPLLMGQLKTYITLDAGPDWDLNRVNDPGKLFAQSATFSSVAGVSLWQEVFENMSVGTGIGYHTYFSGINMIDQRPVRPAWKSYSALLVPARVAYRVQLSEFPVSLTFRAGYQLGLIRGFETPYTTGSTLDDPAGNLISYSYSENAPETSMMHLIELGGSLDYRFPNNWQLSFAVSHFSGLTDVFTADLNYFVHGGNTQQATYYADGGRLQSTFSLYIPVSNIWNNQDLRIRTRIEQSVSRGNGVKQIRYIYFGGDIGSLWRGFRSSNLAIAPRPMTERGVFRYANLHTGGYIGYKFSANTAVDVGAYYQRSSLFFALLYDHETDFVTREHAPFFLEVPVMFRYYYDVYKSRIFIVPAIGASMLTHFSGDTYLSSDGAFENNGGNYTVNYSGRRTGRFGAMIKAGVGVEYTLPTRMPLIATANITYNHGLVTIDQVEIASSVDEFPAVNTLQYSGSGWNASLGVKVPIVLGKDNRKCGALPRRR